MKQILATKAPAYQLSLIEIPKDSFVTRHSSLTDYATAVAALESALATNGYAACQVYANNDGTTHSINAYLTFEGLGKYDFKNDRQWQTLEVQITER